MARPKKTRHERWYRYDAGHVTRDFGTGVTATIHCTGIHKPPNGRLSVTAQIQVDSLASGKQIAEKINAFLASVAHATSSGLIYDIEHDPEFEDGTTRSDERSDDGSGGRSDEEASLFD